MVLGAGTWGLCHWNLSQKAGCMEGSLEAVPRGNTVFVTDPRCFLNFGAVPRLDGEGDLLATMAMLIVDIVPVKKNMTDSLKG